MSHQHFQQTDSCGPDLLVPLAEIMARIAKLYHVEKQCADMDPKDRRRFRQEHARPVIDDTFAKLEQLKGETIPSDPFARRRIMP